MKSKQYSLPVLLLPMLMASGCVFDKVDQMSDDTSAMKTNTDAMKDSTQKMVAQTGTLSTKMDATNGSLDQVNSSLTTVSAETCTLFTTLRQGDSSTMRDQILLRDMPSEKSISSKIGSAGKYFSSFEFQLIDKGNCDSTADTLGLYASATQEFFYQLKGLIPNTDAKINPAATDTQDEDLFALAAASQLVNPNTDTQNQLDHTAGVAMLDLIHNALEQANNPNPSELPLYQQNVLDYQQVAVQLLRLRVNFLPAIILTQITNIQDNSNWGIFDLFREAKDLVVDFGEEHWGTSANFDSLNVAQLQQASQFMGYANTEINFLNNQKFTFKLDGNLKTFYKNLKLPAPGKSAFDNKQAADVVAARSHAETDLVSQIQSFRKLVGAQ